MPYWNAYHMPVSVDEALSILASYGGEAQIIGGGTDLLLDLQHNKEEVPREALVDVTRIAEMNTLAEDDGWLTLGAAVTHTTITQSALLEARATCMVESCGVVGGPQVRNVGTIGGNVAHALPAGDGTIGLLALGGEIEIATADGTRWIPMQESFRAPGKSFIDRHREVLTRLRFKPTTAREGSAHHRVMRPQGLCLPIISMAVRLQLEADDTISNARISMGPVGPVPFLAEAAMAVLVGDIASTEQFNKTAEAALASVTLRSSKYRASQEYREQMVRTYLPAILKRAAERARGGGS